MTFFHFPHKTGFDISCKLSLLKTTCMECQILLTICMKCKNLLSEKNEKKKKQKQKTSKCYLLWANSADDKLMTFFHFPHKTGFYISCKLSLLKTTCMECQILWTICMECKNLLSEKNEKKKQKKLQNVIC